VCVWLFAALDLPTFVVASSQHCPHTARAQTQFVDDLDRASSIAGHVLTLVGASTDMCPLTAQTSNLD
jgi:ribosome modulation factor